MNIGELKQAVIELGFDNNLDSEQAFYFAANRAITEANDIFPKLAVFQVTQNNPDNLIDNSMHMFDTLSKQSDDLTYGSAVSPRSYCFDCDGNGTAYIEKQVEPNEWTIVDTIELSSSRQFRTYKGFIDYEENTPHRLRFGGNYAYSVKNVAMFGLLYSDDVKDIPSFAPYVRYDLKELADGFYGIEQPTIKEGQASRGLAYEKLYGCEIEDNSVILVPYYYKGQISVWYKKYPEKISIQDDDEKVIDLVPEIAELLPLLVASYVWLEGETTGQAQRYYDLFKIRAREIKENKDKEQGYFKYSSRRGWA